MTYFLINQRGVVDGVVGSMEGAMVVLKRLLPTIIIRGNVAIDRSGAVQWQIRRVANDLRTLTIDFRREDMAATITDYHHHKPGIALVFPRVNEAGVLADKITDAVTKFAASSSLGSVALPSSPWVRLPCKSTSDRHMFRMTPFGHDSCQEHGVRFVDECEDCQIAATLIARVSWMIRSLLASQPLTPLELADAIGRQEPSLKTVGDLVRRPILGDTVAFIIPMDGLDYRPSLVIRCTKGCRYGTCPSTHAIPSNPLFWYKDIALAKRAFESVQRQEKEWSRTRHHLQKRLAKYREDRKKDRFAIRFYDNMIERVSDQLRMYATFAPKLPKELIEWQPQNQDLSGTLQQS